MTDTPKPEDARRRQVGEHESFMRLLHLVDHFHHDARAAIHVLGLSLTATRHQMQLRLEPHASEFQEARTLIDQAQESCGGIHVVLNELPPKVQGMDDCDAVRTLMASTAVEVLTRLRPLRSRLKRLSGYLDGEAKERRHLKRAIKAMRRVRDVCRDLRHLGYVQPEPPVPVSVEECLAEALRLTREALTRRARVEEDFTPGQPLVLGSAGHLLRMFLLLLRGFLMAMSRRPSRQHVLRIQALRKGEWVRVTFSATSSDIPSETTASVLDNGNMRRIEGIPMAYSLPISHAIVRGMGGEWSVDGNEDSGLTCSVRLPVAKLPGPD